MSNLLILLNLISAISSSPTMDFSTFLSYASEDDILFASENNITSWDDYGDYLEYQYVLNSSKGSYSEDITDISVYLNERYPDYTWIRNDDECALTSDVSGHIPIEMQTDDFPEEDIKKAIIIANVENDTSYGGCGPIAALGVMDYFARYLGYDEIIEDLSDTNSRILLAAEVLTHTYFSIFGNENNSLVWPWDYRDCFNDVMSNHGLKNVIVADDQWTLFGGEKTDYWNDIVESIDNGLPVTLFTGPASGNGSFSQHYTNIYGYETWVGIPDDGGDRVTKNFIKARLNWGRTNEYYCDADILDDALIGIVTYDVNYDNSYSFYAYDFAQDFVNSSGGGQYFFYDKSTSVTLSNGKILQTTRLRTSYIENQYLVLSPNRDGAGTAYLDITFPNAVSKLSFSAAMWSNKEGAISEDFVIQYYDNGWIDHISIDPYYLSSLKDYPDSFKVLFPKDTTRIRFYATHSIPAGDRNKGRICLDDFTVEYN